jgi:hypothetical protein
MLSPEAVQRLRGMSIADKLRLTLQMIDESVPYLTRGTSEEVCRRFELLRRENDERNRRMLEAIARTKFQQECDDPLLVEANS